MKKNERFQGKIENLNELKKFYMVFVEGSKYPPLLKHEKYQEAFEEMLRLAKKENAKAYVMEAITQVEQIQKVTQL